MTSKIAGIAAGTGVQVQLAGPGLPSSLAFGALANVPVARSFSIPPGGGHWSGDIVSIGGAQPPSSGAHSATVVQC